MARQLRQLGHTSVDLDLREPADHSPFERIVVGDIRDPQAVRTALQGCDAVINLAAAHHDHGIEREGYFSVNEGGMATICDAMAGAGIRDLVFYSSVAVYGDAPPPVDETSPFMPNNFYGASKLAGEQVVRRWIDADATRRALIIRPTVVFGPGNTANMYALIRQIASGRFLQVGAGTNTKSVCYVDNLVAATLQLWSDRSAVGMRVYNYVDKPDFTSRQIVEAISRALGRPAPRLGIPLGAALLAAKPFDWFTAITGKNLPVSSLRVRKFADSETVYEAARIRQAGVVPPVPLEEGLRRMCEWYLRTGAGLRPNPCLPPTTPRPGHRVIEVAGAG